MTLTAIIWTVTSIGIGAVIADDKPTSWSSRLLTFIAASCFLWVVGVVVWLIVGRVLEVVS